MFVDKMLVNALHLLQMDGHTNRQNIDTLREFLDLYMVFDEYDYEKIDKLKNFSVL